MKSRGIITSFILAGMVLMGTQSAFAAEEMDVNVTTTTTKPVIDQYGDSATVTQYYNSSGQLIGGEISKDFDTSKKNPTKPAIYWNAKSKTGRIYEFPNLVLTVTGTGTSRSYANSGKTIYKAIDKIGVKTYLYNGNTLFASKSDANQNASTSAATAKTTSLGTGVWKDLSNHTFEHTGYNSYYPTTQYTEGYFG